MSMIRPLLYQSSNGINSNVVGFKGAIVRLNSFSIPLTKSDTVISGMLFPISKLAISERVGVVALNINKVNI